MFNFDQQAHLKWHPPPAQVMLQSHEVHLWFVSLQVSATTLQMLAQRLSSDEQQRSARFHFERDQRRFITSRATLRTILGKYLEIAPEEVCFCYGPHGKPAIATQSVDYPLSFNLSHAHESALVAVARGREVGVDIEHRSRVVDAKGIVERFFASSERLMYESASEDTQRELFLRYWTCKEALMKATGQGLSLPLKQIEIQLTLDTRARLAPSIGSVTEGRHWTLHELRPSHEEVAALVVEGPNDFEMGFWQITYG